MSKQNKRNMTEDEKKKKFGKDYDPDFKKGDKGCPDRGKKWDYSKRTNDWRWYSIDEKISKNFGNLPFNLLAGVPFTLDLQTDFTNKPIIKPQLVMAINVIDAIAGAGTTMNDQSGGGSVMSAGLRTAGNQLYQYLRHVNSGARTYEPADIMMFILAVRDIYAEVSEIRRALGLTRYYSLQNVTMPEQLIKALQIDYGDMVKHIANYRGRLNTLIARINAFAIPDYFKAFYRTDFIFSNVFMDSTSPRGQFYLFRRTGYYTFSGTTSETGTELVYTDYFTKKISSSGSVDTFICTLNARLDALEGMIDAIESDTDALTMAGDVLSAFKESNLLQIGTVPDDYLVMPIFDENILAQIENCIPVTTFANSVRSAIGTDTTIMAQLNVKQENGQIKGIHLSSADGTLLMPRKAQPQQFVFNSHVDQPDYTHILDWTRLMSYGFASKTGTANNLYIQSSGLEIPVSIVLYNIEGGAMELVTNMDVLNGSTLVVGDQAAYAVSQFDWHPILYRWIFNSSSIDAGPINFHLIGDLKMYTVIDRKTIVNMNSVANLAAFYADGLFTRTKG